MACHASLRSFALSLHHPGSTRPAPEGRILLNSFQQSNRVFSGFPGVLPALARRRSGAPRTNASAPMTKRRRAVARRGNNDAAQSALRSQEDPLKRLAAFGLDRRLCAARLRARRRGRRFGPAAVRLRPRARPLAGEAGAAPAAAAAAAPEKAFPPVVESVDVSITSVDVVVTDSKGHRVPDLTAEDFEVKQDGIPQKITNFYAVSGRQDPPGGRQVHSAGCSGGGRRGPPGAQGALHLLHRQPEHPAEQPEPDVQAPEGIHSRRRSGPTPRAWS